MGLISMDFITGTTTAEGCNALWVVVDRLTKMAHFVACSDTMRPEDLAASFVTHVIRPHGIPPILYQTGDPCSPLSSGSE